MIYTFWNGMYSQHWNRLDMGVLVLVMSSQMPTLIKYQIKEKDTIIYDENPSYIS